MDDDAKCSERRSSSAELAVNLVFIILSLGFCCAATLPFLRLKDRFPIAQRLPLLSVLSTVSIVLTLNLWTLMGTAGQSLSCGWSLISLFAAFPLAFVSFLIRFSVICIRYQAAEAIANQMMNGGANSRGSLLLRIKTYFSSTRRVVGLVLVVSLILWIPAPFVFGKELFSGSAFNSDSCFQELSKFVLYLLFLGVFIVIALIALAFNMRKVKENFFIRKELWNFVLVSLGILVLYAFLISTPAIRRISFCDFRFILLVSFVLPSFFFPIIAFINPLRQVRSTDKELSKKSVATSTAVSSDTLSFNLESLQNVLRTDTMRAYYSQFLIKELAAENLLFWVELQSMKALTNLDDLKTRVKTIYNDFCMLDSVYAINISSMCKESLDSKIAQVEAFSEGELTSFFNQAQKEIEKLMLHDSFSRFCISEDCQKMCTELKVAVVT